MPSRRDRWAGKAPTLPGTRLAIKFPGGTMRLTALGLGFVAAMAFGNAAFAQDVKTDYNTTTDFSRYKTYSWIKEPQTRNPLTRQRVIDEVNAALKAKGLQLVTSDAELCIAAHAATKEQQTLNTFYDGFGGA